MQNQPAMTSSLLYSGDNELFNVRRLGKLEPLRKEGVLRVSVDCTNPGSCRKLFFGLSVDGDGVESQGIAVSIETDTGIVTDLINDLGIIGYFENSPLDEEGTTRLGMEVDLIGGISIPTLSFGGECLLHPALGLAGASSFVALGGIALKNGSARTEFVNTAIEMIGEPTGSLSN